jgi:type II secretory pathway component PulC
MRSILVCFLAIGCGGNAEKAPPATPTKLAPAAATNDVREPAPTSSLKRSDVRATVKSGMGALLQRVVVDTDQPVFRSGKFLGFRITQVPREWGIDLKPGDVVVRVNGFPVERPESAYEALQSLEVASELRVDYERNGEPRSLRYSIVDD